MSTDGQIPAYVDERIPFNSGDNLYKETIRTASCELLTSASKCSSCKKLTVIHYKVCIIDGLKEMHQA